MSEGIREEKNTLPSQRQANDSRPNKIEMTEIMKAHLDLIEGGGHFSKWSSIS